jgi:hypothetical protein
MAVTATSHLFNYRSLGKQKGSSPPFLQAGPATPQDIAYAVLYLTADEALLATKANLKVDSGRGIQISSNIFSAATSAAIPHTLGHPNSL